MEENAWELGWRMNNGRLDGRECLVVGMEEDLLGGRMEENALEVG
jgi:hypothetical protein